MKPPKILKFIKWEFDKKRLPKEYGLYAVICRSKEHGEWLAFAEYLPEIIPNCKIIYDRWKVLGIYGDIFAKIKDNDETITVVSWSKVKPG